MKVCFVCQGMTRFGLCFKCCVHCICRRSLCCSSGARTSILQLFVFPCVRRPAIVFQFFRFSLFLFLLPSSMMFPMPSRKPTSAKYTFESHARFYSSPSRRSGSACCILLSRLFARVLFLFQPSVTLLKLNTAVGQDLSASLSLSLVDLLVARRLPIGRLIIAAAVQPPKRHQVFFVDGTTTLYWADRRAWSVLACACCAVYLFPDESSAWSSPLLI